MGKQAQLLLVALKYVTMFVFLTAILQLGAIYLLSRPDAIWAVLSIIMAVSMTLGTAIAYRSKWLDLKYNETILHPEAELSLRELEVFNLLITSKTNSEISAELFIEMSTLKSHINSIYKKLRVARRAELRKRYHLRMVH